MQLNYYQQALALLFNFFLLTFLHLLHSLHRHLDGFDEAVFIEIHAVNAGLTMVSVGFYQRTSVVNNVPLVLAIALNDGVMARSPSDFIILFENFSHTFERAER